jgi:sec-independent protein translocase protein TatB
MFDLGFSELLLVAVVALIVLGPERLPKAARFAGLWVRRARTQWNSVKSELERELAAEELKRSVQETRDAMQDLGDSLRASGDEARRELEAMREQTRDAVLPASQRKPPAVTPSDTRADDAPAQPAPPVPPPPTLPTQDEDADGDRR